MLALSAVQVQSVHAISLGEFCVGFAWNQRQGSCMDGTILSNCFDNGDSASNWQGCYYICDNGVSIDQTCLESCLNAAWEYQWNVSLSYPVC